MDGSQPPRFDPLWADKKQKASAAPPQAANGVPPMLLGESSGRLQLPPEMVRPCEAPPMVIQMDPKAYGAAVAGHVATLVLFTVSWCAPCKLFQPSFEAAVPAELTLPDHMEAMLPDVVAGDPTALTVFLAEGLKDEATGKGTSSTEMSSTGVWGVRDPKEGTVERGRVSTEAFVAAAVAFIERWNELRPPGIG